MPKVSKWRLLNRDGTFNIARSGLKRIRATDLYHSILSQSWATFMSLLVIGWITVNALFALAYLSCGSTALEGIPNDGSPFIHAFFFSVQTLATIGYGKITPNGIVPNLLVSLEALIGLFTVALATGLLFARFARPTARVIFSNHALISPIDGVPCLIFRMANERLNQIVDAQLSLTLTRTEYTAEGQSYRNFFDLELERARSPVFALTWTVVHPITEKSPLYGMTPELLEMSDIEIFANLLGTDETFSQTIHARFSYGPEDIKWNRYFVDILSRPEGRLVHIDLEKIHEHLGNA